MKKQMYVALLYLVGAYAFAQSPTFNEEMLSAITIHDDAKDVTTEIKALNAFENLEKKYPDEWLPSYWASYLCTQIGRLDGQMDDFPRDKTGKDFFMKSREHLEQSKKKNKTPTDDEKSDLLMLDGFIYSFYPGFVAKSDDEKKEFKEFSQKKYEEATKLNPRNPTMYVFRAISLSRKDDYRDKVAAIGLFDYTLNMFEQVPNRAMTRYWAKDFIKFWRARTEKSLAKTLESKD